MKYTFTTINTWEELEPLKTEWDSLVSCNPEGTIFQLFDWHKSWWHAYGTDHHLNIVLVTKNDELVGIIPLMITDSGDVELISSPETEYQNVLFDPSCEGIVEAMTEYVFTTFKDNVIHVWEVPAATQFAHAIRDYISQSKRAYYFDTNDSFQVQKKKKPFNKQSIKARFKKMRNLGEIEFVSISDPKEFTDALELFFAWHYNRFGTSPSRYRKRQLAQPFRNFYQSISENLHTHPEASAHMMGVKFRGTLVALEILLEHNGVKYSMLPSYDTYYHRCSPGAALNQESINVSIQNNIQTHDFLRGDEDYKMRYADTSVPLIRYSVFPSLVKKIKLQSVEHLKQLLKPIYFGLAGTLHNIKTYDFTHACKKMIFWGMWYSGIAWSYQMLTKKNTRVLSYHSISSHPLRNSVLSITPQTFKKQMKYVSSLVKHNHNIEITFDDGYKDNFDHAFPVINGHELTAKIFPTIDFIEQGVVPGWNEEPDFPALTWDNINDMHHSGRIEFGGHTLSHPNLKQCSDEELSHELATPRSIQSQKLYRHKVDSIAYPFGKKEHVDVRVAQYAQHTGYKQGYTLVEGTNKKTQDPYLLKRMVVFDEPQYMFKVRVSGILDDLLNWYRGKAGLDILTFMW